MTPTEEILKICNGNPALYKNAWYDASRRNKRHLLSSVPADFQIIKKEMLAIKQQKRYEY
jgi:hypothetical protein